MKKLMSILLCTAVLLAFAGCSAQTTTTPAADPTTEPTVQPTAEPAEEIIDEPIEEPTDEATEVPEADGNIDAPLYTIEYDAAVFALTASDSTDTYALADGGTDARLTVQYLAAEEVEAYTAEQLGDGAQQTTLGDGAQQTTLGAGAYAATMKETESEGTKTAVYLVNLPDGGALALTAVSVNGAHSDALTAMLASFTMN